MCSNGGLIDYFVSHVNEVDIVRDVRLVKGEPTTPHFPVEGWIPANIKDTMVKEQVLAPKWLAIIGPQLDPWSWDQATNVLEEQGWKAPYQRYCDARQEYYALSIGTKLKIRELGSLIGTVCGRPRPQYSTYHNTLRTLRR